MGRLVFVGWPVGAVSRWQGVSVVGDGVGRPRPPVPVTGDCCTNRQYARKCTTGPSFSLHGRAQPQRDERRESTRRRSFASPSAVREQPSDRRSANAWFDRASVLLADLLCDALVLDIILRLHAHGWEPSEMGGVMAGVVAGYYGADLISGVFLWFTASYRCSPIWNASPRRPERSAYQSGVGVFWPMMFSALPLLAPVAEDFYAHDDDPQRLTRQDFWRTVAPACRALMPALVALLASRPPNVALETSLLVGTALLALSPAFHLWSHVEQPPRLVRWLQHAGILVGRAEHAQHHANGGRQQYCHVSGHCNTVLDGLGVFRALELLGYVVLRWQPMSWRQCPRVRRSALSKLPRHWR
ncbi:hypothetical protein CDCA_CDCA14G3815 [Cyanidium caldarium]|uniref:Lipid desaturase domain-containing protein n=1 Tax=Cyanidium caldarium TaxID=2771 RepID=A0AAV9J086_CYACA|nr:hypothetical protein CDCA_CDCA14G3815 [Cyanidium caldarium]